MKNFHFWNNPQFQILNSNWSRQQSLCWTYSYCVAGVVVFVSILIVLKIFTLIFICWFCLSAFFYKFFHSLQKDDPAPSEQLGQSGCDTSFEDLLAGVSCKFVLALVIIFLMCFLSFWSFRSGSWAEPNSNRRPTQTIWTSWIDSDVAWFSDVRGRWRSLSLRREAKGTANDLGRLMIRLIIQTPILIPAELNSKGEKCSFRSNYLQNTL